jgi:hypothetical protein
MRYIVRVVMMTAAVSLAGPAFCQQVLRVPPVPLVPLVPLVRITDAAAQPIRLAAIRVQGAVVGHVGRTTIELTFRNPNGRVLEGELQFPLLEGQEVTGFALDVGDKWRPAVAVEKARGQEIFEEITRVRVDPALLEATRGNNFKLRLYPIPANGVRKVSLTVSDRLSQDHGGTVRYRLPIPAADRLESFDFRLTMPGRTGGEVKVVRGLAGAQWWRGEREARPAGRHSPSARAASARPRLGCLRLRRHPRPRPRVCVTGCLVQGHRYH